MKKVFAYLETKNGARISLICIYLVSISVYIFFSNPNAHGPIHFNDEITYWRMAKSIFDGSFSVTQYYNIPPLYAISLLPAFYFFPLDFSYEGIKIINVLLISSVVFPSYCILRKTLNKPISLIISSLLMIYPSQLVFSRSMLSENLFYPLFLWIMFLSTTNLFKKDKKILEEIIIGILLGLLMLTRYISVALLPGFFLIWWIKPFEDERGFLLISWKKLFHALLIVSMTLLTYSAWIAFGLKDSVPFLDLFGFSIASKTVPDQLTFSRLFSWIIFYFSYTVLLSAPYLLLLLATSSSLKTSNWREFKNRWLISVIIIEAFFLIASIRHSWKAFYNIPDPMKIQGRYIMVFGPLFILSFGILAFGNKYDVDPKKLFIKFIISIILILASYSILFKGWLFINHPLDISRSSPFGELILCLKENYLWIVLIFTIAIFIGLLRKKCYLFAYLAVFSIFLVYGDYLIYQNFLAPRQIQNNQIVQVIKAIKNNDEMYSDFKSSEFYMTVNNKSTTNQIHKWEYAFQVHGFTNYQLSVDEDKVLEKSEMLNLEFSGHEISLYSVSEFIFKKSDDYKFKINNEYFIISELIQ